MSVIAPQEPTAPNPSTAMARVFVDELTRCGLQHIVMSPGSRSTALALAAYDHPGVQLHVHPDERSAAFVALGIGRATGRAAAVVVTSGTAVANLLPACVEADHDRVPLLLLTADRPPELHGTGANQTITQLGIFGDSPRWTIDVGVAGSGPEEVARWRWTACRAYGVAIGEPVETPSVVGLDAWREPGPVHCNMPFREPTVPANDDGRSTAEPFRYPLDGRPDGAPWAEVVGAPHVPNHRVLDDIVEQLLAAERPLIVIGGGVGGHVAGLDVFADVLAAPLLVEPHADLDAGAWARATMHASLLLGSAAFVAEHAPDLVVRIGRPTVGRELTALLDRTPQLVIDAHGGWGARDAEHVTLVLAHPGRTVAELNEQLAAERSVSDVEPDRAWSRAWAAAAVAASLVVADHVGALSGGLSEPAVARTLTAALPNGAALVVGSSMPIRDLDLVGLLRGEVRVHANRGASGIDGVVSTALGVALGHDGPTVALVGDLTLLHDTNAWLLSPAGHRGAPNIVMVVVDNDGGGIFSFLPQREHLVPFERIMATPHGRDLRHLAALHGLGYTAPGTVGDLVDALSAGIASGGRHLVHVRTDRESNVVRHRGLRKAVTTALAQVE